MSKSSGQAKDVDVAQAFIEELLRAGLSLCDMLASLLDDLPDDAFPGEDGGTVLIEMVVGSCRPVIEAAGEADCWAATALVGAVRDKVIDDLRAAVELAQPSRRR